MLWKWIQSLHNYSTRMHQSELTHLGSETSNWYTKVLTKNKTKTEVRDHWHYSIDDGISILNKNWSTKLVKAWLSTISFKIRISLMIILDHLTAHSHDHFYMIFKLEKFVIILNERSRLRLLMIMWKMLRIFFFGFLYELLWEI